MPALEVLDGSGTTLSFPWVITDWHGPGQGVAEAVGEGVTVVFRFAFKVLKVKRSGLLQKYYVFNPI